MNKILTVEKIVKIFKEFCKNARFWMFKNTLDQDDSYIVVSKTSHTYTKNSDNCKYTCTKSGNQEVYNSSKPASVTKLDESNENTLVFNFSNLKGANGSSKGPHGPDAFSNWNSDLSYYMSRSDSTNISYDSTNGTLNLYNVPSSRTGK